MMRSLVALLVVASSWSVCRSGVNPHHQHHHGHHQHHKHRHDQQQGDLGQITVRNASLSNATRRVRQLANGSSSASTSATQVVKATPQSAPGSIARALAGTEPRAAHEAVRLVSPAWRSLEKGRLDVIGPLPTDFAERFATGVAEATGCGPEEVRLLGAVPLKSVGRPQLEAETQGKAVSTEEEIIFESRGDVVQSVEIQATNPASKLANGRLHSFLVAQEVEEEVADEEEEDNAETRLPVATSPEHGHRHASPPKAPSAPEIDLAMPYGDLEPFGQEDTAQELTKSSIHESDAMVDQLERAEVAEEKRAVFRALTRLRGAAITSFDGIARSQTGNVDEFAAKYQWRQEHPVHHLAQDESDISRWAFPDEDGQRGSD